MGETLENPKTEQKNAWVKGVLKVERGPGSGLTIGQGRESENDKRERAGFDMRFQPPSDKLDVSLGRTKGLAGVDNAVRVAEINAGKAREAALAAANGKKWDQTVRLLGDFDTAMGTLDTEYTKAAAALGERLARRLAKLQYFEGALKAASLNEGGATFAIDKVNKAIAVAKPEPADKKLVVLTAALATADGAAVTSAKALKAKGNNAELNGLDAVRKRAVEAIGATTDNVEKKRLQGLLDAWDKQRDDAIGEQDVDKRKKALTGCQTTMASLLDQAATACGGNAEVWRQVAYQEALTEQFGIKIKIPPGVDSSTANTNYEMFYDMLTQLPVEHTMQDSLKKLTYDATTNGAAFNPGNKAVIMGKITKGMEEPYTDPVSGLTHAENWFKISTLHEVGHSVDDKFGIMSPANMSKETYGGWQLETVASIVPIFAAHFIKEPGKDVLITAKTLSDLITAALESGTVAAPPELAATATAAAEGKVSKTGWTKLKPFLDKCASVRDGKSAWEAGKGMIVGTRAYHQAYSWQWVSYSVASRAGGIAVRDYQWRAPGEWFAEIYAYSWMKKQVPPKLDPAALKFMWSAKR